VISSCCVTGGIIEIMKIITSENMTFDKAKRMLAPLHIMDDSLNSCLGDEIKKICLKQGVPFLRTYALEFDGYVAGQVTVIGVQGVKRLRGDVLFINTAQVSPRSGFHNDWALHKREVIKWCKIYKKTRQGASTLL